MNMATAVESLKAKGLDVVQMQYSGPHQAFDLPDGRTVVFHGDAEIISIEVIVDAGLPKSQRQSIEVEQIIL